MIASPARPRPRPRPAARRGAGRRPAAELPERAQQRSAVRRRRVHPRRRRRAAGAGPRRPAAAGHRRLGSSTPTAVDRRQRRSPAIAQLRASASTSRCSTSATTPRLQGAKAQDRAGDFNLEAAGQNLITRTSAAYFNVLVAAGNAGRRGSRGSRAEEAVRLRQQAPGSRPGTDHRRARSPRPVRQRARQHHPRPQRGARTPTRRWSKSPAQPVANLKGLPDDFKPALPAEQRRRCAGSATRCRNNPALKAQEASVEVGRGRRQDRARRPLPHAVPAGGSYGKAIRRPVRQPGRSPAPTSANTSVGVTLNVPIFAGGATQSGVRRRWPSATSPPTQLEQQTPRARAQHPQRLPGAWWPASARSRRAGWRWSPRRAPTTPRRSAWKSAPAPCSTC